MTQSIWRFYEIGAFFEVKRYRIVFACAGVIFNKLRNLKVQSRGYKLHVHVFKDLYNLYYMTLHTTNRTILFYFEMVYLLLLLSLSFISMTKSNCNQKSRVFQSKGLSYQQQSCEPCDWLGPIIQARILTSHVSGTHFEMLDLLFCFPMRAL